MADREDEVEDSPATWENVLVGQAKEFVGRVVGNEELAEEGEDQTEVAHEVRDEYEEEDERH
jgi:uncharacterized protein YjbJ (UPF0337 family)